MLQLLGLLSSTITFSYEFSPIAEVLGLKSRKFEIIFNSDDVFEIAVSGESIQQ